MLGKVNRSMGKSFFPNGYELKIGETNVKSGNYTGSIGATVSITEDIIPLVVYCYSSHDESRSTSGISGYWQCLNGNKTLLYATCNRYGTLSFNGYCDLAYLYNYDFEQLKLCKQFINVGGYLSARYTFKVTMWLEKK